MKRLTILFYVLVVLLGVEVNAQTKGLIYKPADGGKSVLDPNLDGYVSKTDQGFTSTDDETESEIPYVPLPVFGAGEPDSDNSAGPSCGFVDLVRSAENETIYTYSNSTNLLFRFRLGGTAENSKGYTILVDSDGLFGNGSDPDYTTGNPGFEYEITLRTNFGVSIYDIDNNTLTSTEIGDGTVDRPYDDFAQKAIAGSEICGTDYFYDFYVPYADLPFDSSTPVRMVGGTTIAPKNSTGFKMADLGGIDDDTGVTDDLFEDLIDIYPPTSGDDVSSGGTIDPRAECPLIDGPIGVDDTSISGTTSEVDGATIELFRDGVSQGTTLATGGTWSFSGLAAAVAGEVFIATAKVGETAANATGTSKKSTSFSDCDATTVGAVCSDPIDFAASTFSISNRGLCATGASGITGAQIKIYYNGSSTPRTDADTGSSGGVAGEVTVDGSGGWNFKCNTNTNCGSGGPNCGFPTTGVFGITQTETGKCESEIVYYCVGITNSATPTITTSPITTSTTSITGFATTGAIVELYIDDVATGTTFTAASNAYTLSLPTVTVGQSISVYATESGNCPTQSAATLVTNAPVQSAAPIIEGEYCGATTSISGVTASGSGTSIQVYKSSTSGGSYIAEGSSIVTTGASWTVSGLSLSVGEFVVAKATGSGETESDFSNEIEILSQTTDAALSITNPASPNEIRAGDASISGKGTPGNTVFLYLDGFIVDETTYFAVVDGLGDWTISGLDAGSAGYDVLYAEAVATVTSKSGSLCESDPSAGETVLCELPDNSMTFSATSATTICAGETIDFSVSTTENLVVYELIDQLGNGVGPAALGDGNSLSLTTYAIDETVTSISLVASRIGVTCEQTVGTITVSPEQINLTHVITQQPNNCLSPDGVITLSGLNNNQTYTLDYKVDGVAATTTTPTSNGSGEIAISGLGPGEYSDITITGTAITLTCGNVIDGPVVLTNVASPVLTLGAVTIPGTCGATTGSIALTSSLTGSIITYTINYLDDGVPKTATENADLSGNILLSGLDAGVYANINIVPPSGCKSNSVGPVTIADPDPTILISGSSNPLACGGNGSINLSFTDFTDGTYEIFYDGGSFPGVNVASNAASISAPAGSYVNLRATESATGCLTDEDPDVTLSDPATHTIAATRTNPTTCGGNGSVNFTFTGVPDNTYTINYDGGSFTGVSVTSNTASVSAPAGIYSNLSISVSGCTSSDFPSVTLTEPADPLAPTVTFDGSYCVGDVIVAPTTSGSSLQWYSDAGLITTIATVDPANPTNAELGFSSATANTTTVYVTQTVNSCESNGTAVSLIVSDPVTIALGSISYPSCGSTDGNIQLTGLANNTTYQVDFSKDGAGVIRNSTSDGTGNILLTNLGGGSYTNISVSLDGCQSNTLTGPVKLIDASTSGGIIINEASNGSAGSEDWVELLVIGDANNPTANVDISGWYFDDNNGDFESATGTGVASGSLFFGSSWNSVPPGSLIIIYNQSDKDPSIGTDDPDDTGTPDGVYILPGNHSSLEGCSSSSYDCSPGVTTASWSRVAFRNDGDAVQVRMPNGDFYHGFSYGDVTAPFPTFPCGGSSFNAGTGGAGSTFSLGCGDWTNSANYSDAEARSPGASNPSNNATLIAKISNGSFDYSNYSAAANCAASGPTSSVISGDATICVGGSTNVVVAITGGTSPYTVVLSDGTSVNNYISGSNISVSPSSTTAYTITSVTDDNSNAGTGNSGSATVTVNADPNITAQPSSVTECVGTSTTLSVTAAGGASGLTYQWQSSTTSGSGFSNISGATSSTYAAPTTAVGTTYYQVIVSDAGAGCGSVTSSEASVTVNADPNITAQPSSVTECVGTSTTLSVTAAGGASGLTYQWQSSTTSGSGFSNISGATSSTYAAPTTAVGTTYYQVIVSDAGAGCGSVTSSEASVTVNADPNITAQPSSVTECVGTSTTLSVTAAGGASGLTYQWQSSTTSGSGFSNISGATSSTYAAPTTAVGTTYYQVIVSDAGAGCGSVTSSEASVTVNADPNITAQPSSVTECVGTSTTLSVTAAGGASGLTYQWQSSTTSGSGFSNISGATSSTYAAPTTAVGTTYYQVIVSDAGAGCGSVTSSEASVTVNADPNITAQPSSVTECVGTSTTLSVTAAGGASGLTYQWQSSTTSGSGFSNISGATSSTYAAPTTAVGTTYYQVIVSDAGAGCGSVTSSEASVTVNADPNITAQPSSVTECVGTSTTLSVTAAGGASGLTYQWQSSTTSGSGFSNISGATSSTYAAPTTAVGTTYYQVIVSDAGAGCGSVTSSEASVTVNADPNITAQPSSVTECVGTSTTLSVTAAGGASGLTYQWQSSTTSGSGFSNISGATSSTYAAPTTAVGTTYYQVIVSDAGAGCGSVTSSEASVTVNADPNITAQPSSVTECVGTSTTLSVTAAGGASGLTYQWQSSTTSGSGFSNISGATSSTYAAPTTAVGTTYYQVIVSDAGAGCGSVTSSEASVTVNADPNITAQPSSVTECVGTSTTLSVTAAGGASGLTYQWQSSTTSGSGFSNISGATSSTYAAPTTAVGTTYYQVIVSDAGAGCGSVTSSEASVTVNADPNITAQPSSVTECVGTSTTLSVTAAGGASGLTYQWQSSTTSGSGFSNISGATSSTYAAPTTAVGTTYYQVIVSDAGAGCGSVTSSEASVTVNADPNITAQPSSVTECVGTSTTLSVTAAGGASGLTYQWQSSTTSGSGFSNISGATSSTYAAPTTAVGTTYYQVIVSDAGAGCGSVTSSEASVTVNADPNITAQPSSVTECVGTSTTLSVTAAGGASGLTYQWQSSTTSGSGFSNISGATSSTYAAPTTAVGTTYYQVIVSDAGAGCGSVTSSEASVTVNADPNITAQPSSVTECVGTSTTLSVTAAGGASGLTYQWQSSTTSGSGFSNISGATSSTYAAPTTAVGTTYYQVIVSDAGAGCGSVTSSEASVTVNADPNITAQPSSVTECVGTSTTLSVTAAGGASGLTYQWQSSTTSGSGFSNISGATSSTYAAPTTAVGTTYYQVIVSDAGAGCGSVTSSEASVTVNADPNITAQPSSVTECVGTSTTLSVTAAGGASGLTYQWQSSTTSGSGFSNISGATSSTYAAPTTAVGTTYYQVIVSDAGAGCGSVTSSEASVTVVSPPSVPTINNQVTNQANPTITGSADSGNSITMSVGGATFSTISDGLGDWSIDTNTTPDSGTFSPNLNGTNEVVVSASNGSCSTSDVTTNELVIDTTAPATPTVTSQTTNDTSPIITGTAEAGSTVAFTIGGATYSVVTDASGNWSVDTGTATPTSGAFTALSEGTYDISITSTDAAGNSTSDVTTDELVIDTTAPATPTVTSQITNDTSPIITGTAEAGSTVVFTIGGATYSVVADASGNWSVDTGTATPTSGAFTALSEGTYDISITSTDAAGNSTSDVTTDELVIDTTAPVTPTVTSQTTNDTSPIITGTAEAGSTVVFTIGGATYSVVTDASGNWSVDTGTATPTSGAFTALSEGTYDISITSTDAAGNSTSDVTTDELVIDTTAPATPTVTSQTTNDTSPIITGTAEAGSTVVFTIGGATYSVVADASGNWSVDTGTATPTSGAFTALSEGTYDISITSTDAAGNSTSDVTTDELVIDTTAPVTPTVTSQTTNDTSPIITGTAEAGSTVVFTIGGATYSVVTDASGNWSVDTGTATPTSGAFTALSEGTYDISITSTDAAGNSTSDVTTDELVIDTTAPATPTVTSQTTNDTSPIITGTAEAGSTVVFTIGGATYSVVTDASGNWSVDTGTATPTSGAFTALSEGTYDISITSTDAAGNSTSDVTTDELVIDTTAPVTPTVTSQTTNDTSPIITGTAEAGSTVTVVVGGATYIVTADGSGNWTVNTEVLTPTSGTFNPDVNGTNEVSVTSTDSAGNSSSDVTSGELIIDTTAPVIPTVNSLTTNDVTPVITGTAEAGSTVTLEIGGATYVTTADASGNWSIDTETATTSSGVFNPNTNGPNEAVVTSTDGVGNSSTDTTTNEIVIDTTAPVVPTVNSQITNDTTPIITGTTGTGSALPSGETMTVTVNGATYSVVPDASGNWSVNTETDTPSSGTLGTFTDGSTYQVVVTVTDSVGNSSTDTTVGELVIDTSAPASPTVSSQVVCDGVDPILTGTTGTGAGLNASETMTLEINGATYTVVPNASGDWSVDTSTDTPTSGTLGAFNGGVTYAIIAEVSDSGSNTSSASGSLDIVAIPTIALIESNSPTTCGGSDGSISLSFTNVPNGSYSLNYVDGASVSQTFSNVSVNSGAALISGLPEGTYNDITLDISGCVSTENIDVMLTDPLIPTITVTGSTNPVTCGGNGTISLSFTNVPNGLYTIDHNAGSFSNVSVNGGTATILATEGTYTDLGITVSGCTSLEDPDVVISDPSAEVIALAAVNNPTTCSGTDGSIELSGLTASSNYVVNYEKDGTSVSTSITSDGSGIIRINGLNAGDYTNISTSKSGCTSNSIAGPITLNDPTVPTISINSTTNASTCGGSDGVILLDGLAASTTYTVEYKANGSDVSTSITSLSSGLLPISGLSNGNYTDIRVTNSGCVSNQIDGAISITDPSPPSISSPVGTDPSSCASVDGNIDLNGFDDSETYTISFDKNGTTNTLTGQASSGGTISISGLNAGSYENVFAIRASDGCQSNVIPSIVLNPPDIKIGIFVNPSTCTSGDGSIEILSMASATSYQLNYKVDGVSASEINITSNSDGEYLLENLPAGSYTEINVTNSGCVSNNIAATLTNPSSPTITLGTQTDPTTCGGNEGSIQLTGLQASTSYSVSYTGTSAVSTTIGSDGGGNLTITGLQAGTYSNISVSLGGCNSNVIASVTLNDPVGPSITIGTNPEVCQGESSADLSYSGTTGSPDLYSIDFDATAEAQGFVDISNASLGSSPISLTIPAAASAATYNASVTVQNSGSGCSSSASSFAVVVNALPAVPTVTNLITNDTSPTLTGTADAGSNISVVVGGATFNTTTDGSGNWSVNTSGTPASGTFSPNVNGVNEVVVTADLGSCSSTDNTSNELTIDTTDPVVPVVFSQITNDTTPIIRGTAEPGSTVTVIVGGATYIVTADANGNWSVNTETATPASGTFNPNIGGANEVQVTATDAAGNSTSDTTSDELTILAGDSDGDGILDFDEDTNGDGDPTNDDSDGDGTPDYLDTDDDGDGVATIDEDIDGDGDPTNDDTDGDGTPDYLDSDDDGDGIPTEEEDVDGDGDPANDDTDGDGTPDYLDNDDDGDGILTEDEDIDGDGDPTNDDSDGDGTPDYIDEDDDGDGVTTGDEDVDGDGDPTNDDTDGDGTPDYLDTDDDGDGVSTEDEDVDGDGDPTNDDTDGDGTPDYLDEDDDGDGVSTEDEDTDGDGDPTNDDCDSDGTPNYLDADPCDSDGDGILDSDEDSDGDGDPNNDDCDSDGVPNYLDSDPCDSDGDGILDNDEDTDGDGNPYNDDCDGDGIPNFQDNDSCDSDGDGVLDDDEDEDGDGNPYNDDCDGDGIPNFQDSDPCDTDSDGITDDDEDTDGDGNPYNDDCDGDGIPNFLDTDPCDTDGDGIDDDEEDTDGDGNPYNDDCDEDGIPNFQDPDVCDTDGDGIIDEDEDTNDDGDLTNDDCDEDGIPNYLDPDVCLKVTPRKGFTPDGDGVNDFFYINDIELYPNNNVQIYNRWGNKVFEIDGYDNQSRVWSSEVTKGLTYGEKIVPDGTYYYLIDLGDGSKPLAGFVVVNR